MKTHLPKQFAHTTLDGWVKLAPGEAMGLCIDTPVSPTIEDQRFIMQRVRGWVLSAGFTLENNAIRLQLAHEFATTDPKIGGDLFTARDEMLRADRTEVERRLEGVKPIVRAMLPHAEADKMMQDLAEYRRVRHCCAHRPSWLAGIWDPEAGTMEGAPKGRTTGFKLFIADSQFQWEIDQDQIRDWEVIINRAAQTLEKLVREILQLDENGHPLSPPVAEKQLRGA